MSRYIVTTVTGWAQVASGRGGGKSVGLTAQVLDSLGGADLVAEYRSEDALPTPMYTAKLRTTEERGEARRAWVVAQAEQHAARLNEEYEAWLLT